MLVWEFDEFLDAKLTTVCNTVTTSLRRPHIVDKVVMAFPLKSTYEKVSGSLEGRTDASGEKETCEALQDLSRDDDDDDPGGDDPSARGWKDQRYQRQIQGNPGQIWI